MSGFNSASRECVRVRFMHLFILLTYIVSSMTYRDDHKYRALLKSVHVVVASGVVS